MDEADRMVNLGFEADLTFILDKLPSDTMEGEDQGEQMDIDGETVIKKGRNRVTTLFSATMPPPVERLAKKYLKKPAIITIGEAGRAVDTVEQRVEFVNGDEKKKWVSFSYTSSRGTNNTAGNGCLRSSTLDSLRHRSSCLSTRRRRQIWLPRICTGQGYVSTPSLIRMLVHETAFAVECCHPPLRQESRTARSRLAISPHWRFGHSRGYRSCWPWY